MTTGFAMSIFRIAIYQTLTLAAPTLIVALILGLIISIFQATTQIQDQTLTFVPKIVGILVTLVVAGNWLFTSMTEFFKNIISLFPEV